MVYYIAVYKQSFVDLHNLLDLHNLHLYCIGALYYSTPARYGTIIIFLDIRNMSKYIFVPTN